MGRGPWVRGLASGVMVLLLCACAGAETETANESESPPTAVEGAAPDDGPAADLVQEPPGVAVDVALGREHACAVLDDGRVRCWGVNFDGALGDGTGEPSYVPVTVVGIDDAVGVSAWGFSTCALLRDQTVRCWGSNDLGQLGDGSREARSTPVAVEGVSSAVAIAVGGGHACALLQEGEVRCWGGNEYGQLGDGTTTDSPTPVTVSGISDASLAITAGGRYTCVAVTNGAVRCWGYGGFGQLGNGSLEDSTVPVGVTGVSGAIRLSAGPVHACAMDLVGALSCWGDNAEAQLGDGGESMGFDAPPVGVTAVETAQEVSLGTDFTCALLPDGAVACWGINDTGQLGGGSPGPSSGSAVMVSGVSGATAIASGPFGACAVVADGRITCWGQVPELEGAL